MSHRAPLTIVFSIPFAIHFCRSATFLDFSQLSCAKLTEVYISFPGFLSISHPNCRLEHISSWLYPEHASFRNCHTNLTDLFACSLTAKIQIASITNWTRKDPEKKMRGAEAPKFAKCRDRTICFLRWGSAWRPWSCVGSSLWWAHTQPQGRQHDLRNFTSGTFLSTLAAKTARRRRRLRTRPRIPRASRYAALTSAPCAARSLQSERASAEREERERRARGQRAHARTTYTRTTYQGVANLKSDGCP